MRRDRAIHPEQLANSNIPLVSERPDAGDDPAGKIDCDCPFEDLNGAWVAVSDPPEDPAGEPRIGLAFAEGQLGKPIECRRAVLLQERK